MMLECFFGPCIDDVCTDVDWVQKIVCTHIGGKGEHMKLMPAVKLYTERVRARSTVVEFVNVNRMFSSCADILFVDLL